MAGKKIYVHFGGPVYVNGKSELLKAQMEILYLRKVLKNLALTRTKKVQYKKMLEETLSDLKISLEKLDSLMPDEEIPKFEVSLKKKSTKTNDIKKELDIKPVVKKDDIEEELLRIKQKLDSLNRA